MLFIYFISFCLFTLFHFVSLFLVIGYLFTGLFLYSLVQRSRSIYSNGTSTRYTHPLGHPHYALCVRVCIYVNGCPYRVEEPFKLSIIMTTNKSSKYHRRFERKNKEELIYEKLFPLYKPLYRYCMYFLNEVTFDK